MTVSYSMAVKNRRMAQVTNAIDSQAAAGYIEIGTAGMSTVLAQVNLSIPSFSISNGVMTMLSAPITGSATNNGTAAAATICDGSGNVVVDGLTVGTSGSDVIIDDTTINSGDTVTVQSATISHSP